MKIEIIAEIGSNWEGSVSKGYKIIQQCKSAGANGVKFQMWRATDLYKGHPQFDLIKKSELSFDKAKKLKNFCDDIGIEFFCSTFYPEAVSFLESIDVKKFKIASRTCLLKDPFALDTLKRNASTKKPILLSMGMGGNKKFLKKIFLKNKPIFMYCISEYPTDIQKINWNDIVKFDGFSDHTLGITAPIIFSILKKQQNSKKIYIEKHVKLADSTGPDAPSSITTDELSDLIYNIRLIEKLRIPKP